VLEWVRDALHASHGDQHQSAEQSYMDEDVQILELARNAERLFERQEPHQKRRLLNFVLSNCTWEEARWSPPSTIHLNAEELVAELTSAFLCAELGVQGELRHSGYIDHWIKLLKSDPRAIFTAASKASRAANYLRSFSEARNEVPCL
jgi:hypothetical protein